MQIRAAAAREEIRKRGSAPVCSGILAESDDDANVVWQSVVQPGGNESLGIGGVDGVQAAVTFVQRVPRMGKQRS